MSHVTNHESILVSFHPFGNKDDIHQKIQDIESIELPKIEYIEGGGKTKKNLKEANDYLKTNFPDEKLVCFPPKPLNKKEDNQLTTDMDRFIAQFESNFNRKVSDRRRIIIPISQKVNKELLNRHGFCFDGNDNLVVFDGALNIIIFISFANEDFLVDLEVLHKNIKAFVKVCADIFNVDASNGDPVAVIGFLYHSTADKEVMLNPVGICKKKGYYCGNNQISNLKSQEDFDVWYEEV